MIACSSTSRGPGHPHGQRQQAEHDRAGLVVVVHQGPIAPHAGEMIDVARLGDAHDGVDQEPAADLLGRPLGELLVGTVQGVAGLEGDDPRPAQRLEVLAQLGRRPPQLDEVIVGRGADHLEPARGVVARLAVEVGHGGVLLVERAVGVLGLVLLVRGVDLLDVEEGQQIAVDVAQGQRLALVDPVARRDGQGDRQGPERAVGQPHLADHAVVVGLAHEAAQRREAAHAEELEVAESALVQRQAGMVLGGRLHLGGTFGADDQIDQCSHRRGCSASG